MAEKDTADPNSPIPLQEPLTVSGGAARLLDRFPEADPSLKEPDPKPTGDADPVPDKTVTDDADPGGLEDKSTEPKSESSPLHKVKVDGVEEEITLDEALRGYSRTADYKRKTRQLAENRRSLETEVQATRQARDAYGERLKLVEQALDEPTPDWVKVKAETPGDFPELYADWQLKVEERQKVKALRERVATEQAGEAHQQHRAYLDQEAQLLQERIPEFAEPEKAGKLKTDLFTYGEAQGFSRDELGEVADHRALVILNKARLYDAIVARKADTKTQAATSPTVKPGARPPAAEGQKKKKAREDAQKRLKDSGQMDDAVAALMEMD